MKHLTTLLGRAHDKVIPLHHFQVNVWALEHGEYPAELYGGKDTLRRRDRRHMELVVGTLLTFITSGFILDAIAPGTSFADGIKIIGPTSIMLLAVAGWAAYQLHRSDEQNIRELSQRAARRAPLELRLEWESCTAMRPILGEALSRACSDLTEAEAEVVKGLSAEHTGTIRELVEIARAVCAETKPPGVQHESSRAHS